MELTSYLLGKKQGGGSTINNQDKTVTSNGSYTADSGYTGLGTVTVNVPTTPTNPTEYKTATNNYYSNYLTTIPTNRQAYTSGSLTLYTPSALCKKYMIIHVSTGYKAIWFREFVHLYLTFEPPTGMVRKILCYYSQKYDGIPSTSQTVSGVQYYLSQYYYSPVYENLDELISDMQTANKITYTLVGTSSTPYVDYDLNYNETIIYSDANVFDGNSRPLTTGILTYDETITAQS